jgi:hypothetical protein
LLECLKGIVYRGTEQAAEEDGDDDDFVAEKVNVDEVGESSESLERGGKER